MNRQQKRQRRRTEMRGSEKPKTASELLRWASSCVLKYTLGLLLILVPIFAVTYHDGDEFEALKLVYILLIQWIVVTPALAFGRAVPWGSKWWGTALIAGFVGVALGWLWTPGFEDGASLPTEIGPTIAFTIGFWGIGFFLGLAFWWGEVRPAARRGNQDVWGP